MNEQSLNPGQNNSPVAQAVVFTMLSRYSLQDNTPISTANYIDILGRAGISHHASRLILSRMVDRGYLHRIRDGRMAYWAATDLALAFARRQQARTFPKNAPMDEGVWTILSYSIPESRRKDRDRLRKRLEWDGFGLLRDGVWIAAGDRELTGVLDPAAEDEVGQFIEVFTAYPKRLDMEAMIARAWDLDGLRERHAEFLRDWDVPNPAPMAVDALGRNLLLITRWRKLIRGASRLPQEYLAEDTLAQRCSHLFRELYDSYSETGDAIFHGILENSDKLAPIGV